MSKSGPTLTPEERSLRASIAAHEQHARASDPAQGTAPARAAFLAKFEREVDPDGTLDPEDRARRADHAMRAHMARLSLKASRARGASDEAVADLLKRTRTDRGMTLVITDPIIIAKVAHIVTAGGDRQ